MNYLFCQMLRILVILRWVWIGSPKHSTEFIWIGNTGCRIRVNSSVASTELLFWCSEPGVPSPGREEDQRGGIPRLQGNEYTIKEEEKNCFFGSGYSAPHILSESGPHWHYKGGKKLRKIRLIECNAKCSYLKNLPVKGFCARCFIY
jgi:hypothetical protein